MEIANRSQPRWRQPSAYAWFFLVAQLVLAVAGIGVWQAARAAAPARPDGPPPELDAAVPLPATIESAYPLAEARARQWRDDAVLFAVSEQIEWPGEIAAGGSLTVAAGGWLTYVFIAPWDRFGHSNDAASFSLRIDRTGGIVFDERVESWSFEPEARIPVPGSYRMDSTAVALAAEVTGGRAFREACPRRRHVSRLALDIGENGAPVWTVAYLDDRFPDEYGLMVSIDAQSGQIGEVIDRSHPCDREEPGGRFGPALTLTT